MTFYYCALMLKVGPLFRVAEWWTEIFRGADEEGRKKSA